MDAVLALLPFSLVLLPSGAPKPGLGGIEVGRLRAAVSRHGRAWKWEITGLEEVQQGTADTLFAAATDAVVALAAAGAGDLPWRMTFGDRAAEVRPDPEAQQTWVLVYARKIETFSGPSARANAVQTAAERVFGGHVEGGAARTPPPPRPSEPGEGEEAKPGDTKRHGADVSSDTRTPFDLWPPLELRENQRIEVRAVMRLVRPQLKTGADELVPNLLGATAEVWWSGVVRRGGPLKTLGKPLAIDGTPLVTRRGNDWIVQRQWPRHDPGSNTHMVRWFYAWRWGVVASCRITPDLRVLVEVRAYPHRLEVRKGRNFAADETTRPETNTLVDASITAWAR